MPSLACGDEVYIVKFTNHTGKKTKCDCCAGKLSPSTIEYAVCRLEFNDKKEPIYFCETCVEDLRRSVRWLFT
jgi:hypothetical protein